MTSFLFQVGLCPAEWSSSSMKNLARKKPAYMSSSFNVLGIVTEPPRNAVDGKTDSVATSDTKFPVWFYVNLKATAFVHHIRILNRPDVVVFGVIMINFSEFTMTLYIGNLNSDRTDTVRKISTRAYTSFFNHFRNKVHSLKKSF